MGVPDDISHTFFEMHSFLEGVKIRMPIMEREVEEAKDLMDYLFVRWELCKTCKEEPK